MTKTQIAVLIGFALLMFSIVVEKHMLSQNLKSYEERLEIQTRLTDDSINLALRFIPPQYKVKYLDALQTNLKKVYAEYDKKK